jgi:hypothetical protein
VTDEIKDMLSGIKVRHSDTLGVAFTDLMVGVSEKTIKETKEFKT